LRSDSFDQAFARRARMRRTTGAAKARNRSLRARMPSTSGYIVAAGAVAAALFFTLWWMLHSGGDDAPWVPAGLAASVVMLVAIAAREVVMRRAWTRYILEHDRREQAKSEASPRESSSGSRTRVIDSHTASLRAIKRQCAEADAPGALPEAHLEAYLSCQDYLDNAGESLRSTAVRNENLIALHAGQEHVRALARHHLLDWARGASRTLTHQAQQRVRMSDKIETAHRALEIIDSALKLYPEETDLRESEAAVHEFISSVKVSHWIELAERAAFKGHYTRAIDRYRDALFYLSREKMKEETRAETAARIGREIELLRARLKTSKITVTPTAQETKTTTQGKSRE
jgi:tetratricopeptide (TPR) repeat protein